MAGLPIRASFNTQPPEGGWNDAETVCLSFTGFNTQPPEGGWEGWTDIGTKAAVSTHSRLKAAGYEASFKGKHVNVSTHSRLKAAGALYELNCPVFVVSTHSRLKAAGASLKSLAPSGLAAPISLGSQEKREREYNTAFSVTPAFAIS